MEGEKLGSGMETGLRRSGLICSIWTGVVGVCVVVVAAVFLSGAHALCLRYQGKWNCHVPFNEDFSVSLQGFGFIPPEKKKEGGLGDIKLNETWLALVWLFVAVPMLLFLAMGGLGVYFLWLKEERGWARYAFQGLAGGLLLCGSLGGVFSFVLAHSGLTFHACNTDTPPVCKTARPKVTSFVGGGALLIVGAILGALYGLFLHYLRWRRSRPPKPLTKQGYTPTVQPSAKPLLLPEQRMVDVDIPAPSLSSIRSSQGPEPSPLEVLGRKGEQDALTSSTVSDSLLTQASPLRRLSKETMGTGTPRTWTPNTPTSPYNTTTPSSTPSTSTSASQDPASPSSKTPDTDEKPSAHSFSSLMKPFLS